MTQSDVKAHRAQQNQSRWVARAVSVLEIISTLTWKNLDTCDISDLLQHLLEDEGKEKDSRGRGGGEGSGGGGEQIWY